MPAIETLGKTARYALGGVRILAGGTGLLAPAMIISRFGDGNPAPTPPRSTGSGCSASGRCSSAPT